MSIAESQAPPVEAEVGVSAAVFADKWGAVRLGRFADWGPTVLGFSQTIFGAATAEMLLLPILDPDVGKRQEAAQRPGTPESEMMNCLAIQFGTMEGFIAAWGARLPRRRIDEFASDVDQLVNSLRALAERACEALE